MFGYLIARISALAQEVANTSGTVNGPAVSVPGNLAMWSDATGTTLADAALPAATVVTLLPSSDEKDALAGTAGTPDAGNRYVTDQDPRLLSLVTFRDSPGAPVVISDVADTLIIAAPPITPNNLPVYVTATFVLENADAMTARIATIKMFKDGIELLVGDDYEEEVQVLDNNVTVTVHYVDPAPGAGPFTYDIRAIASGPGLSRKNNGRITAIAK